jgi:hypothetical protein
MKTKKLTEPEIRIAMTESYNEAGYNAHFGNGFSAGVKFAEGYYLKEDDKECQENL